MSKILCATRGGEASYCTQDNAIALAKERGDTLVFLYVVDLQFLDKTAAPIVVDVGDEVTKMGEFLLLMAKGRAAEQGVSAEMIIRVGRFREDLPQVAREENASLIVLGRPDGAESASRLADLEAFAAKTEIETGIETVIF